MSFFVDHSSRNFSDLFPVLYQNRYCDQQHFSIAVFGGETDCKSEHYDRPFLINNVNTKVYLPSAKTQYYGYNAIASGSDIYLTYLPSKTCDSFSVMKYSTLNNIWKSLPSPNEHKWNYYVCCFMQRLFVIGGKNNIHSWWYDTSCTFYDKKSDNWSSIANMMEGRGNASCTVFEGKIVVSGGFKEEEVDDGILTGHEVCLKSIEAYDYYENKWSSFPSMLFQRQGHTAVSVTNKMFMIGGHYEIFQGYCNSEVFDSVTRKFTYIKNEPTWMKNLTQNHTVSFGYKIYFFVREDGNEIKVHSYDVKKDLFSYKTSLSLEDTVNFSTTKVPMI